MNTKIKPGQIWRCKKKYYIRTFIIESESTYDSVWVTVSHNGHYHKNKPGGSIRQHIPVEYLTEFFEEDGFVLEKEDVIDPEEQKKYHTYDWYLPPDDWWNLSPDNIKKVLEMGHRVFWKNRYYEVIKDAKEQYLLHCHLNDTYVGVFKTDGTLVEDSKEFFHVD